MIKKQFKRLLLLLLIIMIIGKAFSLNYNLKEKVKDSSIEKIYVLNNNFNDEVITNFKEIINYGILDYLIPILDILIVALIDLLLIKVIKYYFKILDKRQKIRNNLISYYNGSKFKRIAYLK